MASSVGPCAIRSAPALSIGKRIIQQQRGFSNGTVVLE
jgi:hypothetical protein